MDQKTKPWAFPKPHPENTPRGERNKQEFDVPPAGKPSTTAKPRAKKPAATAGAAKS
ncbi:hypothetical protein [Achromobacter xylosoxidans]|uniref:hypothetical protein n=1 Tax=Alcaligenes xylosoxydans xylosoxydans TaxID=85698 RepID=UPI000B2E1709|nr:hypothetical protein [Achromobacter xylosoxidans]